VNNGDKIYNEISSEHELELENNVKIK